MLSQFIVKQRTAIFTRSSWFTVGKVHVYLRAGSEYFDRQLRKTIPALAISNVDVDEHVRRKGHFTQFLKKLEAAAIANSYEALFVEQIHNPHLRSFLLKQGFTILGTARDEYLGDITMVKYFHK